jgi:GntR family phosphonate transport system transcriptional regulator
VLTYALSRRTRFARNLIEQGFDPGTEKLLEEVVPAGAEVAARLGIPEWQSVAHRRGISRADGVPVEMGDAYVPLDRFPDFWNVRAKHVTYSATFAAYGVRDYIRQSTLIGSRMPTEEEAALLEQSPLSPVFVLTRVDADLEGRPILFGRGVWSAERVEFDLTLGS